MKMKNVRISKENIEMINRFKDMMKLRGVELTQMEIISDAIRFAYKNRSDFFRRILLFSI